jgi:hypothetical protein
MRRFYDCSRKSNYKRERDNESQEEKTITSSNPDSEPEQVMEQIHRINMLKNSVLAAASSFKRMYK